MIFRCFTCVLWQFKMKLSPLTHVFRCATCKQVWYTRKRVDTPESCHKVCLIFGRGSSKKDTDLIMKLSRHILNYSDSGLRVFTWNIHTGRWIRPELLGHLTRQFILERTSVCPSSNQRANSWVCAPLKYPPREFSALFHVYYAFRCLVIGCPHRHGVLWLVHRWLPSLIYWKWLQLTSPFGDQFWLVLSRFSITVWWLVWRNPDLNSSDLIVAVLRRAVCLLKRVNTLAVFAIEFHISFIYFPG